MPEQGHPLDHYRWTGIAFGTTNRALAGTHEGQIAVIQNTAEVSSCPLVCGVIESLVGRRGEEHDSSIEVWLENRSLFIEDISPERTEEECLLFRS